MVITFIEEAIAAAIIGFIVERIIRKTLNYINNRDQNINNYHIDFIPQTTDGEVGYKSKSDIYRPNIRITKDTPTTFKELSDNEIKVGRRKKLLHGRVDKFKT